MTPSHPLALDAPTSAEAVADFLPKLERALDNRGPALLPMAQRPEWHRSTLIQHAKPEIVLETENITLLVPTSGSTGAPKVALLSASALKASASASHRRLGGSGRWLLMLPTTHIAGLQVLVRSVVSGFAPTVLDSGDGFSTAAMAAGIRTLLSAAGSEPCYTAMVPTQLVRVIETGGEAVDALCQLDAVLLGGAPASGDTLAMAREAGVNVVVSYGMTETCGGCVYDGVPLDGVRVTVDATGRICVSGEVLFSGYRLQPTLSADVIEQGQYRTNDLGRFDEAGRLHVAGRVDDVVLTGGVNVSCRVVEEILQNHSNVQEVVVVGRPDEQWGERIVAVVDREDVTLAELQDLARAQLEPAALPRELIVVTAFPRLASGKLDREAVRRLVKQQ